MNQDNNDAKSGRPRDGRDTESSTISGKTHEVAETVRNAALERVQSARQSAESAKQQAAERVRKFGATIRKVGEHLRVEDQNYIAGRATNAGQRLDDLASYIDSAELSTLARDTEDMARRKPLVFFGGAFLAGLAAGRFLKVSGSGSAPSAGRRLQPDRGARQ